MSTLLKYRERFWGTGASVVTGSMRRERIKKELQRARQQYLDKLQRVGVVDKRKNDNNFTFTVNKNEVCEKAFVNVLGIADLNGHKSKMWNHEVQKFKGE